MIKYITFPLIFIMLMVLPACEKSSHANIPDSLYLVPAVNIAKVKSPATEKIDEFFQQKYNKGLLNGVVLFSEKGNIIYENAFGYSDFKTKDSLSINSVFQLASVSKQFTAAAALILIERGLLDLNDPVYKYIPDFPFKTITIKHLLTHSAGLPDYMHFADEYWNDKSKFLTNSDVLNIIKSKKIKPYFTAGKRFLYSNTGYAILAVVIENVSQKKFKNFLFDEIFEPLQMNNTFVFDYENPEFNEQIAAGHRPNKVKEELFYQDGVVGDKGVFSTVEDMLLWDIAMHDGTILTKETLKEAYEPAFKKRSKNNYGYGWRIKYDENNKKIIYHGGWWKGYKSFFIRDIENQRTAIVLLNTASYVPFRIKELLSLFEVSKLS